MGDWGLGTGPNPQSPKPTPQNPNPKPPNIKIIKLSSNISNNIAKFSKYIFI